MTIALLKEARVLANYIETLDYNDFVYKPHLPYKHIGAFLTDISLQAGLNYNTVVRPRVGRVLRLFPEATTLSTFESVINIHGIKYVMNWKDNTKADRLLDIVSFGKTYSLETETQFANFLGVPSNQLLFRQVKGIGPKTIDYSLKLLCVDTVAVDRHIFNFVNSAGINRTNYQEIKTIVEFAADLLQISRIQLDSYIWLKMSNKKNSSQTSLFIPTVSI